MKIICTIGENINSFDSVDKFVKSGTDMFRFKFSHINYEESDKLIKYIKSTYPNIPIIEDLQGNKVRISTTLENEYKLLQGEKYILCSEKKFDKHNLQISENIIPITFQGPVDIFSINDNLKLNNGSTILKIRSVDKNNEEILVDVVDGGLIKSGQSINVPRLNRDNSVLTIKDLDDIIWGLKRNVDIIIMSYIANVNEITKVKKIICSYIEEGVINSFPLIFAKIECISAIKIIDDIINEADGIVIGRGDLSKEIPLMEMPIIQEKIISMCRDKEKPIFISNNILNSMCNKKYPSVNEICELHYHLKEQVTGIVLCDEVSKGKYPLNALRLAKSLVSEYKE